MKTFTAAILGVAVSLLAATAAHADSAGLVAAYGFEEATGTAAADSSSAANAGVFNGATRSASGRFGAAASFDGVNDRIDIPDSNSLDLSTGMTLEAWLQPAAQGWRTAILKERPGGIAYALYASTDSNRPSAEITAELRGPGALPSGAWSHLTTTFDGATLRLYVNGTQVSSRAVSAPITLSSGALRIGGNTIWSDEHFRGLIDEVRVYNRALTAGEILTDMNAPVVSADTQAPTAPALTASLAQDDVHLSWSGATDNVGITAYRVFRDGTLLTTLGAGATSYDDVDRPYGAYRYTVRGVDAAGNVGAISNEEVVSYVDPDAQPPTAPVLSATITDHYDVHLAWTAATDDLGVKEYRVYKNSQLLATVSPATSEWTHVKPSWGPMGFSVVAVDNAGHSTSSTQVGVDLDPDTTTPVPVFDGPCDTKVHDQIEIRAYAPDVYYGSRTGWVEVDGQMIYGPQANPPSVLKFLWETRSSRFPDGPHVMRMHVRRDDGTELVSEPCVLNIDNFDVTATMASPANGATVSGTITLEADVFTDGQPIASDWTGWYPYYSNYQPARVRFAIDGSDTAGAPLVHSPPFQTSYDTTKLPNGPHTFQARVSWMHYGYDRATSETVTVNVDNSPSRPTGVDATATFDDVRVSWDAVTANPAVTGYRVFRDGTQIATVTDGTSYSDDNRPIGTYEYTVVAVNSRGASSPSDPASATVESDGTLHAPTGVEASVNGDDVTVTWDAVAGAGGYRILRNGSEVGLTEATSYTNANVPLGTHEYKVIAVYRSLESPASAPVSVTLADTTPPEVSVGAACNGTKVHDYLDLRPFVSDDHGPMTARVLLDGATIWGPYAVSAPRMQFVWDPRRDNVPNGMHTMTLVVRDGAGNETSVDCEWNVHNPAVTVPFTSPANGATVSGTVDLATQVLTDGAVPDWTGQLPIGDPVVGVSFEVVGKATRFDTSAPYTFAWDSTTVPNGTYTVRASVQWMDYSQPRATSEIQITVDNPVAPPPSGLVAAYGFEQTSGTTVNDSSGRGSTGTLSGATWAAGGKFGRALSFDGVNDLVTVPDANLLDLTPGMTLEAWVKPTTVNDWRTVLLKERPGQLTYALYATGDNGRPLAEVAAGTQRDARGTALLPVGVWTHLAATHDGTTLRLYVNGTQVASTAVGGTLLNSTGALKIGGNSVWGEYFGGLIDEVRVYERALSAAEIAADKDRPV